MLIEEKSSNSLKDCIDYVYCKLRVSKPVLDSDGSYKTVFNGVSVNSWFSPMGITVSPQKELTPYSPVNKNLQQKLKERAKSASAVLGRRHFETEQQEVRKDEFLEGNSVFQSHSTKAPNENKRNSTGRFCGRSIPKHDETRQNNTAQRPHTCHGTRQGKITFKRPCTSQGVSPDKLHFEQLCIDVRSLETNKKGNDQSKTLRIPKVESKEIKLLSDFKTEYEMREAFVNRVRSAPSYTQQMPSKTDIDTKCSKRATPLYWRTKSAYHRKHMSLEGDEGIDADDVSRGSLWKPLLYSQDGGIRHKAGCPYKCKGCFRACLVSQDYMDKLMSGKIMKKKPGTRKPKFYHRKIVEYAIANAQPIKDMIEREKLKKAESISNKNLPEMELDSKKETPVING